MPPLPPEPAEGAFAAIVVVPRRARDEGRNPGQNRGLFPREASRSGHPDAQGGALHRTGKLYRQSPTQGGGRNDAGKVKAHLSATMRISRARLLSDNFCPRAPHR